MEKTHLAHWKNPSTTLGKMQLRHWRQYLSGKNPLWKFHGCHRIFRTLSCLDQRASSSKICRKIVPQSRALTTLKIFRPTGKSDILPISLPRKRFLVGCVKVLHWRAVSAHSNWQLAFDHRGSDHDHHQWVMIKNGPRAILLRWLTSGV